jgi:glycosyltransferase involved in cell wall biosynthesis
MTHYAFYPTTGGVESHLLDLCAELVAQGHEVHALVGSHEGSPEYEEIEGIKIYRTELMHPDWVRDWKKGLGYESDKDCPVVLDKVEGMYEDFVSEHDIDVIHAHNFHHFLPEHGVALTELHQQGIPTFLTIHEVWSEFICEDLLERTEWDGIITVSEAVGKGIEEQAPHLKGDLKLIYHGIDTDLFSPKNSKSEWVSKLSLDDGPVVIHPARMLPWKGVIYSVKALDILRKEFPNLRLLVTDTDDIVDWIRELRGYKEDVLKLIDDLGLRDKVITQSFPYMDLPGVYNHCEVVIYPTIGEEPFGLVPVEGMACARPVVVSRSGGLVESVIDGETGYIIEKKDPEALADQIGRILRDPYFALRMGQRGREHAVKNFGRDRMTREVVELYEEALVVSPVA